MATRNPFGQLRVDRDDDEEVTQTVTKAATATPLFTTPAADQKKKKKVRPDEKKKSEEPVQESNEGFEVVGKQKPKHQRHYNAGAEEEEVVGEGKVRKDRHANKNAPGHSHGPRPVRAGKRQFERHSGTGRGRETAKNGAGGKTVWGDNPEFIAKQSQKEEVSRDDHYFDSVLNPRPKKVKEEITETPVVEEVPVAQETPVAEETPVQAEEHGERKKKTFEEKPIAPEELLERPDNALSLAEYREQLKEKNRKILASAGNAQLNVQLPSDLKKLEKETFGVKVVEKKTAAKTAKKENTVQEIAVAFKTEDSSYGRRDRDDFGKKKSKPAPKIRFEDLPSL